MTDIAIRVENLSKLYHIGRAQQRHDTLRDALTAVFRRQETGGRRQASLTPDPRPLTPDDTDLWALKDVSFEVKRGEVVGVIGRNGAGKSTLLKILSRITEPTSGRAEIHGRVGSLLEVGTGFHPELTGRENIYLNGAILGMRRAEIERKFDEIVAFAEIERFLDTPVKRYSSGMYVRLAFAVAAHLEPEILLVDEVLAVGDAAFQKKCLGKMGDVAKEGRTVLFVSHNMAAIQNLCKTAILLSHGCIEKYGLAEDTIGFYLSADRNQHSTRKGVLGSSPEGLLELIFVQLQDKEDRCLETAQCGRQITIKIGLRSKRKLNRVNVSIGINSIYEVRVAVLHTSIMDQELVLVPGINIVTCQILDFPLVTGKYSLDIKVFSNEVILWVPNARQLFVEAGDFYHTGRLPDPSWGGICHIHHHWRINNHA